jgi:hypothetical protein
MTLKEHNELSKQKAQERVIGAYGHWKIHGDIKQAAKVWRTDRVKLRQYMKEQGVIKPTCNADVFKEIDTEEKAYWLGFLYADGAIGSKTNHVELSLQLSDIGHVEKYRKFIDAATQIGIDDHRCRLTVCTKAYRDNLIKWGCTPRKSFTIRFPQIEKQWISAFVRGYFDGDGYIGRSCKDCLYNVASITCGCRPFLEDLFKIIQQECNVELSGIYRASRGSNTFNIYMDGIKFKKFIKWLYYDSSIHLDRKYQRYIESIAVLSGD